MMSGTNSFTSSLWAEQSLEISGIPELGKLIARIIGDVLETGWAFRHKDDAWNDALRADLSALILSD